METFRRFTLDENMLDEAWEVDFKTFFNETRHLLLNCSSPSLPELPPNMGFRNLKSLIMPLLKSGNSNWSQHYQVRPWSDERKDEVRLDFRPKNDETATAFEILIIGKLQEEILMDYFADMVICNLYSSFIIIDCDSYEIFLREKLTPPLPCHRLAMVVTGFKNNFGYRKWRDVMQLGC
ncbi:hypothetical protein N431DRAFT_449445 [Stipitochalara longipes BDJ]|nr:hypothetical protein N431DRAFT_449445 [Stipitochalara longipes BDJ]